MKLRFLLMFAIMATALSAPAQVRRPGGGGANVAGTTNIINDCERRTNDFKKKLDRALGKPGVKLGERENQLNRSASQLEDAMDKVGDGWNKDHNMDKVRGNVRVAIGYGNDINRTLRATTVNSELGAEWAAVVTELNRLASTFGLPRIH